MLNRKKLIIFIISILILAFAGHVSASGVGETISIEGYVDSAGKNSLYVSGKILVANEYSSISTGGTNIFVGDYVMGFIYLNEDMMNLCVIGNDVYQAIDSNVANAAVLGVEGTPSFIIGNHLITGYITRRTFNSMMNEFSN